MNFIKKLVYSFLIVAGLVSHQAQALHMYDERGRTSVINLVIKKEQDIAIAQADLKQLWNTYFYNQAFQDGYHRHGNGTVTPRYKYLPIRKIYTTDAQVAEYQRAEQDFYEMIHATVRSIESMVRFGVDINAQDNEGNTVLNYCYTPEIYEELIRLGAHFQLQVWAYFNPGSATLATIGSLGLIIGSASTLGFLDQYRS